MRLCSGIVAGFPGSPRHADWGSVVAGFGSSSALREEDAVAILRGLCLCVQMSELLGTRKFRQELQSRAGSDTTSLRGRGGQPSADLRATVTSRGGKVSAAPRRRCVSAHAARGRVRPECVLVTPATAGATEGMVHRARAPAAAFLTNPCAAASPIAASATVCQAQAATRVRAAVQIACSCRASEPVVLVCAGHA